MKSLLHCLLSIAIALLATVGCDQPPPMIAPSGNTVRIGVIAPLSGEDEAKGQEGIRGIDAVMAVQPLLANGDRIEIVTRDNRNEPAQAIKVLKELAETERVSAIVTFSTSGPVLAMASVADTTKTPILAVLATHPDVVEHNDWVSQICFDDIFQGDVAALYARDELLIDTAAVFSNPGSAYSSNLASEFERKFTAIGGTVTDTVYLAEGKVDWSDVVKNVRTKQPEFLYLPVNPENVIRIIRETEIIGWKPVMMAGDGLLADVVNQHPDQLDLLDGLLATDFYHSTGKLTPFGIRMRKVIKKPATSFTVLGMEGFALLLDAMNRCDDPSDRECINARIRSTSNFEGVMGLISIGADGKADRPLVINTIRGEVMKFVVKVY